jgi:hypothetical protein
MIRSDIVHILAGVVGCLALAACPDRPGEGETDSTISGDPGPSPATGPFTTTNEPPTGTTEPSTTEMGEPTTTDTGESTSTGVIPGDDVGPHEGPWEVVVDALPWTVV